MTDADIDFVLQGYDRTEPALQRKIVAALVVKAAEADKLQAFKAWVHGYLDAHGVPHHPPGVHGPDGCRIGDRMDWLLSRIGDKNLQALVVAAVRLAIVRNDLETNDTPTPEEMALDTWNALNGVGTCDPKVADELSAIRLGTAP